MPILTANERIGTEVGGRYRLERILGEGGFSAVFLGQHLVTGRAVAIKLLHAHLVQTEQVSERFLREAQMMAKIRHPGIVEVLDAGREKDGTIFLALELLEGEGLDAVLERTKRLSVAETVRIGKEVLDALTAAHGHGIVHRDIKPANIFLTKTSDGTIRAKLLDFGIAQVHESGSSKLTHQGVILGTPEYMSPEQARGGAIGVAADIWSIGIVLFECLTGLVPWTAENPAAVLHAVQYSALPDIRGLAADIPAAIANVVRKALGKRPEDRFANAEEMKHALAAAESAKEDWPKEAGELSRGGKWSVTPPSNPSGSGPIPLPTSPPPRNVSPGRAREFEFEDDNDAAAISLDLDPAASADATARRTGSSQNIPAIDLPLPPPGPPPGSAAATAPVNRGSQTAMPAIRASQTGQQAVRPSHAGMPATRASQTSMAVVQPASAGTSGSAPSMRPPASIPSRPPGPLVASTSPADASSISNSGLNARSMLPAPSGPGANITFKTARGSKSGLYATMAIVAVAVGAVAVWMATRGPARATDERAGADGGTRANAAGADVAATPPPPAGAQLQPRFAIRVPFGTDRDGAIAFARHLSVGVAPIGPAHRRTIGTCIRNHVYLYAGGDGLPTASAEADIACDQYDLAVIGDVNGDGSDDLAAINHARDAVAVLASNELRPARTIQMPAPVGLIAGPDIAGAPTLVVYAEPNGASGATELIAVNARTGDVVWRTPARAPLVRMGHPTEHGLATGGDANGDGVLDVVAGAFALASADVSGGPARPRCVELLSGANGQRLWAEPFCQLRGGNQSVSIGADVDGDGHADVAIGTELSRGADPRVVVVSGTDARVIARVSPPPGANSNGFGWPVSLGPDLDGDHVADLVVGTMAPAGTSLTVFSPRDGRVVATRNVPGDVGFPNLRVYLATGLVHGDAPAVVQSSPDDGLVVNVFARP